MSDVSSAIAMRNSVVTVAIWTFGTLSIAGLGAGCGAGSGQPAVAPEYQNIAKIHRARCGQCHRRVDPGQRTRAELEPALARHRDRVHLSEEDWDLLVDYLAADKPPAAQP